MYHPTRDIPRTTGSTGGPAEATGLPATITRVLRHSCFSCARRRYRPLLKRVTRFEARPADFDAVPFEVRRTAAILAALVMQLTPSAVLAVLGYAHLMARGDRG